MIEPRSVRLMNSTQYEPSVRTLDDLRRDPKVDRKALAVIERRISKKVNAAMLRAGANTGGSICPRCFASFATYQQRNAHRRTTCTGGAK